MGWLRVGIKICGMFEWSGLDGAVPEISGRVQYLEGLSLLSNQYNSHSVTAIRDVCCHI